MNPELLCTRLIGSAHGSTLPAPRLLTAKQGRHLNVLQQRTSGMHRTTPRRLYTCTATARIRTITTTITNHRTRGGAVAEPPAGEAPEPPIQAALKPMTGSTGLTWPERILVRRAAAALAFLLLVAWAGWFAPRSSLAKEWHVVQTFGSENAVSFALFSLLTFVDFASSAALFIPAMRNASAALPAWPFVALSMPLGSYALLPYLALWQPPARLPKLPFSRRSPELRGGGTGWLMRAAETNLIPALQLATTALVVAVAASANAATWRAFWAQAKAMNIMSASVVDLFALHVVHCCAMWRDAAAREFAAGAGPVVKVAALALFCAVPVAGPAAYLLMRPKTFGGRTWWPPAAE